MHDATRKLIFKSVDQTITPEEFEALQDAIERNDDVRAEYLRIVTLCESLGEIALEDRPESDKPSSLASGGSQLENGIGQDPGHSPGLTPSVHQQRRRSLAMLVLAASILVMVGSAAFWFGRQNVETKHAAAPGQQAVLSAESRIAGHATLRRTVDLKWADGAFAFREGDVLPDGLLKFDEGIAEIDFFCGATLIVEGPAALVIRSDWSVEVDQGRLRANVPPAARGFIVQAAGSEIVDLGTEFAMEVESENARVEVIDGEVEIRGGEHDGNRLLTGQRRWLKGTGTPDSLKELSTIGELKLRRENATSERFAAWQAHSQVMRNDDRLIAYFPIVSNRTERVIRNAAATGSAFDGKLVGPVELASGRFGPASSGLEFHRPGARVRTRIDGAYAAFTFACWVRIDSLERVYNALFMSDGYETGELHWQIRNDGCLMFSVMVDDTQSVRHFSKIEQRTVQTVGLARVYYSDPIWDISQSGQWFHLAAVYDPVSRRVRQYANGKQVGDEKIIDKFHIDSLRIGPAEIGNWGQPFRKTPWFSVRNLDGTIDELFIFNEALSVDEIVDLYEQGKPLGY